MRVANSGLPLGDRASTNLSKPEERSRVKSYPTGYNLTMYTVRQTEDFVEWLDGLKDMKAQVRIVARLRQAEAGNLGDWSPVEGEVSEFRIDYGPGYRLYFVRRGRLILVLLNGGDKSTQGRDIRRALKMAAEIGADP